MIPVINMLEHHRVKVEDLNFFDGYSHPPSTNIRDNTPVRIAENACFF